MKLKLLKLNNYRNCTNLSLILDKNKVLIIGKNAQGKTNILESIYFLSTLKSNRTNDIKELINFNSDFFKIEAEIIKSNTDINLRFACDNNQNKEIKTNNVKTSAKEFKNILKTVLFSTQDLRLLRGTPQDRRNWLDKAISQIYPIYDDKLSKYEKIKTQKNNFLKHAGKTGILNNELLDVYNEQLAITGSNIIFIRKKYLNEISTHAKIKHQTISESENLSIKYNNSFLGLSNNIEEIEDIKNKYTQALNEVKQEEIRRWQTCIGPHRDDVVFYINNQEATKFASQGQQRTIVLALKLSELDIIKSKINTTPILLLDDVLAELDDIRQNYLLKSITDNTQTIITSVDTILFENEFLKDVQIYKIDNGSIL